MKHKRVLVVILSTVLVLGSLAAFLLLREKPVCVDYTNLPADLIAAAEGEIDKDFSTDDYSLVFKNPDGSKTMYIYTHPVRFWGDDGQYHLIDNALVSSGDGWQNTANEIRTTFGAEALSASLRENDVTLFFPLAAPELADIKTILGNQQTAVQYRYDGYTLSAYPTYLGIKCQVDLSKPMDEVLTFATSTNLEIDTSNDMYIQFVDESFSTAALLYQPILRDADRQIFRLPQGFRHVDGKISLDLSALEEVTYPLSLEFTLNMYQKKQADSSILSSKANDNQYLDNYLYAGHFDELGDAESLVRFETSLYKTLKSKDIITAEYRFNGLTTQDNVALKWRECPRDWASTKITWNTRDSYDTPLNPVAQNGNTFSCDVTELVKAWIDGVSNSHNGLQILGTEGGMVFPSADNGYCSPMLVVRFEAAS